MYFLKIQSRMRSKSILIFLFVLATMSYGNAIANTSPTVLILNSYHKEFKWTDEQVEAAKGVLQGEIENIEIFVEYMDTKRIYTEKYLQTLHDLYKLKYENIVFDAILTTDDDALCFVLKHRKELFNDAPVAFCGINDFRESLINNAPKVTGIIEVLDIKPTIDLALKLHPHTEKIVVLVDSTTTGIGQLKDIKQAALQYPSLVFEYIEGKDNTHVQLFEKLRSIPKNAIVLLAVWLRDKNDEYLSPTKGGKLISDYSSVPVYGIVDMYFGDGIVGGKLLNSRTQGKIAAEKAVVFIEQSDIINIPVETESKNSFMFDYDQLLRWKIKISDLPEDSIIINRPLSFYSRYKILTHTVIGVFFVLILILTYLIFNITQRKKAEKELKESEDKFRKIFDLSPQAIALTELESGKIVDVNKKLYELTHYQKDELIGRTSTELNFYSPEDRYRFTSELKTNGNVNALEMTFNARDGYHLTALMYATPMNMSGQNLILTIFADITDQKKLESQLIQAQKMESIGSLAGGIAHDFNNILFPIIGMSEILLEDLPPDSPEYQCSQEILKAGKRGSELVKQILSFGRQSEHKLIPIQIQRVIRDVLKLCRATIPTYIELTSTLQQDTGSVMADPTQIHQIGMNLITNAYHAVEKIDGKISVEVKEIDLEKENATDYNIQPGRYILLSVTDNGSGISPDIINRIFDPYFTTKEKGKGTGLGLATVYGIVKEHKGEIKVHSEVDKGTTFNVYLPKIEQREIENSDTQISYLPKGSENILLIDDEKSIADLEKQMLERLGYNVTVRISSVDALALFKIHPTRFDLIITDMNMPNMTGDALAKEILSIRPEMPIIVCTGFSEKISKERAQAIGVKGLLMKPIVKSDMAEMVRKLLGKAK